MRPVKQIPLAPDRVRVLATYPLNYKTQVIAYRNLHHDSTQLLYAPVMITGRYGKGKVLVIGSNQYLKPPYIENPNVIRLWQNIINWASDNRKICVEDTTFERLAAIARKMNVSVAYPHPNTDVTNTRAIFVTKEPGDTVFVQKLEKFVRNGGTLVYVSSLWDAHLSLGYTYTGTKFNRLLLKAGLYHKVHQVYGRSTPDTMITSAIPEYLVVDSIICNLENGRYKKLFLKKGAAVIPLEILKLIYFSGPKTSKAYEDLSRIVAHSGSNHLNGASLKEPLETDNWPGLLNYLSHLSTDTLKGNADPSYKAITNKEFPGLVSGNAKRINKDVEIRYSNKWSGLPEVNTSFKRWHSTGLYVAPGDIVTIVLSKREDTSRHIAAQIGAHEDDVSTADAYCRNPFNLVKTVDLNKDTVAIHSQYGGLLYFDIPVTDQNNSFKATVIGAVHAPYFKLGKTTNAEWARTIRNYPAPWAELITDKIILTVPSDSIRKLNDPEKLLRFWDEVMDANAELAMIPKERKHPERIIIDNNVKWGYMYTARAKIVAPNDQSLSMLLNERYLRDTGSWGHFHEIGHRHQFFGVDFDELSEVTVNLYTLYVYNKVLKKDIYHSREGGTQVTISRIIKEYIAHPDYDKWKEDPFLKLYTLFYPILDAYGWDAIKKLNTSLREIYNDQYKGVDLNLLYKTTKAERRDHYFVLLSKAIGKNLGSYFDTLRIPVSDDARKQVADLPVWIPDLFK